MIRVNYNNTEYQVFFDHEPVEEYAKRKNSQITKGRETICTVKDVNGNVVAEGVANCCGQDNFSKFFGRNLSMARALKNLGVSRAARKQFWTNYWLSIGRPGYVKDSRFLSNE